MTVVWAPGWSASVVRPCFSLPHGLHQPHARRGRRRRHASLAGHGYTAAVPCRCAGCCSHPQAATAAAHGPAAWQACGAERSISQQVGLVLPYFIFWPCTCDTKAQRVGCGLWRERHGLAVQLAALARVALHACCPDDDCVSTSCSEQGDAIPAIRSCDNGEGLISETDLSADVQTKAVFGCPLSLHAPGQIQGLLHADCGEMVQVVLSCASTLLEDPVWAVRQAAMEQLTKLVQLTD
eukprot:1159552-Pelagomonas_calceolata.AAC.4